MVKKLLTILFASVLFASCNHSADISNAKMEILYTEKAFEKMVADSGLLAGFTFYADENAVINRGHDTLIFGKRAIRNYYEKHASPGVKLRWTPDFIDVSDDQTLGYSYGRYIYSIPDSSGKTKEITGVFHTVWKKQDKGWKYVWD